MKPEKRKKIRIRHTGIVEIATEAGTISGASVDISRTGIQVVVRVPASYDSIHSIAFTIPASGERIQLPCRLVRNHARGDSEDRFLGIEFLARAGSQLLLVDKFIQELQRKQGDSRNLPRTSCHIEDVSTDRREVQILSIENLSVDGLLLSYVGRLQAEDLLHLSITIPGDPRPLRLQGKVVYVIDDALRRTRTAGVRLSRMTELEERRLRNLVLDRSMGGTIRNLHHHLEALPLAKEHRIDDSEQITRTLQSLKVHCVPLSLLMDGSLTVQEHTIVEVNENRREFSITLTHEATSAGTMAGRAVYFTFSWNGNSYFFMTEAVDSRADLPSFHLPALVLRSDSRSYQRKLLHADSGLDITISAEECPQRTFRGPLIDISRRGFLCEILVSPDCQAFFQQAKGVRYIADERLGLDCFGQIRHIKAFSSPSGIRLQIGIEAGIARRVTPTRRIDGDEWEREMPYQASVEGPSRPIESVLVRFANSKGQEICGLINATELSVEAPVIIIPPAYGKKKEAYSPLVATLLASFWAYSGKLAVLRYDGINRPGESHQDEINLKRGYEMLSYRWGQGLDDLEAALSFARNNPYFTAKKVILITFSMSAIEARRLLALQQESGIVLWISCMGAPSAQSTLRNVLGGIDVISNYRTGIPNGILGLLGHLVDMDRTAHDLVEEKYAYVTDARLDMSRIGIPVLWIYGRFDKWIDQEEVSDLMSVSAGGSRELLEIPTGHNLRTSNDAIQTFKLMAGFIYEKLQGVRIVPRDPCREDMVRLLTNERERLQGRPISLISEYWRDYLIGNERSSVGYDFYRNIEEFTAFLRSEVQSLALNDREIIADLGCGTGIFLEVLLDTLAHNGKLQAEHEITAVDLVQEALDKTRAKCERLIVENPVLRGLRMQYIQRNLEPNRLIPVADFIRSRSQTFDFLRGKVEGLSNATLDRLMRCESSELYAFIRGGAPSAETVSHLQTMLDSSDLPAVLDFNRAARFLAHRVEDGDIQPQGGSKGLPTDALRTSDLVFNALNFGDYDRNLGFQFPDSHFTRIVASLFISYIFNPRYAVAEFYRMLKPGGLLIMSSMKPDGDISQIFINFIKKLQKQDCDEGKTRNEEAGVSGALGMLNEAASLFELEEDGFFRFHTAEELRDMLSFAGFHKIEIRNGMGNPPQAHMAIARKEEHAERYASPSQQGRQLQSPSTKEIR